MKINKLLMLTEFTVQEKVVDFPRNVNKREAYTVLCNIIIDVRCMLVRETASKRERNT